MLFIALETAPCLKRDKRSKIEAKALYIIKSEVAASRSEVWAIAQVKYCTYGAM